MKLSDLSAKRAMCFGSMAAVVTVLTACGGGSGSPPNGNINGTAAIGAPLAGAAIQITCKNGSTTTTTDAQGAYSVTFPFDAPCLLTATSGNAPAMHSLAAGPGTYNLTSLTELLVTYVAAQLGTSEAGLLAGLQSNSLYQSTLTNMTVITNAELAVGRVINSSYQVTLSSPAFLTTAFVTGQPGPDADLDQLMSVNAIDADGQPAGNLVSAVQTAGAASPVRGGGSGVGPTGGTGSAGGT